MLGSMSAAAAAAMGSETGGGAVDAQARGRRSDRTVAALHDDGRVGQIAGEN